MTNSILSFVYDLNFTISNGNHIFKIFSNPEAFAYELLENVEEMFPPYHTYSYKLIIFIFSTTQ